MGRQKYRVRPAPRGREQLQQHIRGGKSPARKTAPTRILLKTAEGWNAPKMAEVLDISVGGLRIGQPLMKSEKILLLSYLGVESDFLEYPSARNPHRLPTPVTFSR